MSTSTDVIFGRIIKAWQRYTRQTTNLNMSIRFLKGNVGDPDVSCTLMLFAYPNFYRGTMTHCNRHPMTTPVTGEWYALRERPDPADGQHQEPPQYVTGWGDTIEEAMLDAESKMHDRFRSAPKP